MKFNILTAIIFITFIAIGCDLLTEQDEEYIEILGVEKVAVKDETGKITDTIKINHKFTTEMYGYLPDPCWEIYKINVEELKNEFKITPMMKTKKVRVCPQVIVPCTASVELIARTTADTLKISVITRPETITKTIKVIRE